MSYIVVISRRTNDSPQNLKDEWHHHEDYESALNDYDSWFSSPYTYTISLTAVVSSTDYDPHEVFKNDSDS